MTSTNPDDLHVHYASLEQAATQLGKNAQNLEQSIADLKRAVLNVAQGWDGEAYNAFQAKSQQWDKRATAIKEALDQIGREVCLASERYYHQDLKAVHYFQ